MSSLNPNRSQPVPFLIAAGCVLLSGGSALIYQTTWLREFRLFFGASTAATASVTTIFMGGLGLGSLYFGKRVGGHPNPFRLYARLEVFISLLAACSPLLLMLARQLYLALGGSFALGAFLGNALRLVLAAIIVLPPTFLLGGTLPAIAQAISSAKDVQRRSLAFIYGANTLGAVVGTILSTFFMLEHMGNRLTLWLACLINLGVGIFATRCAGRWTPSENISTAIQPTQSSIPLKPLRTAAAITGFCFFLMELVWYRMLSPILGGSTYTFGIILAVALAGIGAGSLIYSAWRNARPPSLVTLATVTAIQAVCVGLPFAWGDQIAVLAISLNFMQPFGLLAKTVHWTLLASLTVLPAALLAGFQFPLLLALVNRGRPGEETGSIYAWNTLGAILGSLAGGFGLLSLAGAPAAWRFTILILASFSIVLALLAWPRDRRWIPQLMPWTAGITAWLLLTATGPTAAWRHTPIGAGRVESRNWSYNDERAFINNRNHIVFWEAEGVESSLALIKNEDFALMVNGKSDGSTRGDAPTQVLLGLLGAFLHDIPEHALVVGLGTGSSAGWIAQIPSIRQVDVVELEPAVRQAARFCAPVNANAMNNPKVHVHLGDAREAMLTFDQQYDLIASEPSNPYRAGVSSLFTAQFYQNAAQRLKPGGIFVQWLQAYEVDGPAVASVYATLASVFPFVETWQSQPGDLLLLAAREQLVHDIPNLRARIQQSPFNEAFANVCRIQDVEGVFANFVANSALARAYAQLGIPINTDDRNRLEFSFATSVGRKAGFEFSMLLSAAESVQGDVPMIRNGKLHYATLVDRRVSIRTQDGGADKIIYPDEDCGHRIAAKMAYSKGDYATAIQQWSKQKRGPTDLTEHVLLAHSLAALGNSAAPEVIQAFHELRPSEADALMAVYLAKIGQLVEATSFFEKSFRDWNTNPWPPPKLVKETLDLAISVARESPALAQRLRNCLQVPFAVHMSDTYRLETLRQLTEQLDPEGNQPASHAFVAGFEPHVPWNRPFLAYRLQCYERAGDVRATQARRDLKRFDREKPQPLPELPPVPTQQTKLSGL